MTQSDGPDNVRALVCAFSTRGDDLLAPVSTLAIQNELNRRTSTIRAGEVLSQLAELRDLQRLSGGFWLPAPLRLIDCGGTIIASSGLPSARLARQYGIDVQLFSALRVLRSRPDESQVPRWSLFEWLESPPDSAKWLDHLASEAHWSPPYQLHDLKIFRAWKSRIRPRWIEADEVLANKNGIALAKMAFPDGRAQYYLADVRRGSIERVHELPIGSDIPRLMCALRFRDGDQTIANSSVATDRRNLAITFEILPVKETRFIRAMSGNEVLENSFLRKAEIPRQMAEPTKTMLNALGVSMQGTWQ